MRRTITLDVMWQIDPLTGDVVDPNGSYCYGSDNCFHGGSTMTLVETDEEVFAGHIDFDRATGPKQHLGVFIGDPKAVAQQMLQNHANLNATRRDGLAIPAQPAQIVVWLREFKSVGGSETGSTPLLEWAHPAIC